MPPREAPVDIPVADRQKKRAHSYAYAMAQPPQYPEFAVRREAIGGFFDPPMASSTFHDQVNAGRIIPVRGMRGYYKLNESLRRLGLREVPSPPGRVTKPTTEDVIRLGFSHIDRLIFPMPAWVAEVDALEQATVDHAMMLAATHRENVAALGSAAEKLQYLDGIIEAAKMLARPPDPEPRRHH